MKNLVILIFLLFLQSCSTAVVNFQSSWSNDHDRHWLSENFWGNRLQDWKVVDGKLTCVEERFLGMRTVHLLKYNLDERNNDFSMTVDLGLLSKSDIAADGSAGFLIGAGHGKMNTKAAAIIHEFHGNGFGIVAGITATGKLYIHDGEKGPYIKGAQEGVSGFSGVSMELTAVSQGEDYLLTLSAVSADGTQLKAISAVFPKERLRGNVGLFSHPGARTPRGKKFKARRAAQYAFVNYKINGEKLSKTSASTVGAILSTQYTLSRDVMKLTAQLMPISEKDSSTCRLEIKKSGEWQQIAETKIVMPGFTAPFRVAKWNSNVDT
ncbi:MAG: hypothetical protein HRT88_14515, partial [Lentisphaeraceae bacterium]|nr:hypothetical protein [Lentisphaeraceae bacterium]